MPGKALKLTNAERQRRYGVVIHSIEDVKRKGNEKFPSDNNISDVSLVLEKDGTIVENDDHLMSIPDQTVIMMLKPGEVWQKLLSADNSVDAMDHEASRSPTIEGLTPVESDRIKVLAYRIRQNGLAAFVTFSTDDFQLIAGMLPKDLAAVFGISEEKVMRMQAVCRERAIDRQRSKEAIELVQWLESWKAARSDKKTSEAAVCQQV